VEAHGGTNGQKPNIPFPGGLDYPWKSGGLDTRRNMTLILQFFTQLFIFTILFHYTIIYDNTKNIDYIYNT
jgi:hypothetical protein